MLHRMDLAQLGALQRAITQELNARNFQNVCQELAKNAKEFPTLVAGIMKGLPANMQQQIESNSCFSTLKNLLAEAEEAPTETVSNATLNQLFAEMKTLEEQEAPDEDWVLKRKEIEKVLWAQYHATQKRAESLGWTPDDWFAIHGEFYTNMNLAKTTFHNPRYYLKKAQQAVEKFDRVLTEQQQERQLQILREQQAKSALEAEEYEAIISDTDEMLRLMNQYITLLVQASEAAPDKVKVVPEVFSSYAKAKSLMEQVVRKGGYEITSAEAISFLYVMLMEHNAYWPVDIGMPTNRFYELIRETQRIVFRRLGNNSFRPDRAFRLKKAQECKMKLQEAAAELQKIKEEVEQLAKSKGGVEKYFQGMGVNQTVSPSSILSGKPQQYSPYF